MSAGGFFVIFALPLFTVQSQILGSQYQEKHDGNVDVPMMDEASPPVCPFGESCREKI